MAVRQRPADVGSERARAIVLRLGGEIRTARLNRALSQTAVALAARTSRSQVGRIESGQAPRVSILELARLLAVLGLELSATAYPAGDAIRDAGHRALLDRLRSHVYSGARWQFEVPVAGSGDQRAWDAVLVLGSGRVAVEAETRLRDMQDFQRRLALKLRDDPEASAVVLLLADTRHNRTLVRDHGDALRTQLPASQGDLMRALKRGLCPQDGGVVLL
jgi:transcriptional regulator with XRE-family HTH domain